MVKYPLCQARTQHRKVFGESARDRKGVRWGKEGEMVEQIVRLTLKRYRDEYASVCKDSGWSEKPATRFVNIVQDVEDLSVANVELSALADISEVLIPDIYMNESEEPMVFEINKTIVKL